MSDMITRCPKCATAFRISDTLLNSAKGMVRCGSCLNVFNASKHIESRPTPAPKITKATAAPEHTQPPPIAEQNPGSAADAIKSTRAVNKDSVTGQSNTPAADHPRAPGDSPQPFISNSALAPNQKRPISPPISITGFLKHQGGTEAPLFDSDEDVEHPIHPTAETDVSSLFERPTAAPGSVIEDDEPDSEEDESWALELLKDDNEPDIQLKKISVKPSPTVPQSEEDIQLKTISVKPSPTVPQSEEAVPTSAPFESTRPPTSTPEPDDEPVLSDQSTGQPAHDNSGRSADTGPVADAPDKPDPAAASAQETKSETVYPESPDAATQTQPRAALKTKPLQPPAKTSPPTADAKSRKPSPLRAHAAYSSAADAIPHGGSMHAAIAAIEPEPLEVDWEASPNWKKRLLWPALALVAMLVLLGQVAWLEFHRLNQIEPYRSFYAIACEHLRCNLPQLVNRNRIQTSNLVVRSHPEVENALMVDVILQNNADFEQTFPSLLLTFSDLRNEPVASRRVMPDEYLGGELAGRNTMPVRQPIHIGLEIVDPGKEAVSYSIAITD